MNFENILISVKEGISIITINRPSKLNALNKATIEELHVAFKTLNEDKSTKVILITGSGEKAFVAGADIKEFADFDVENGAELARKGQEILFDFVQNLNTPVIAAVNGLAVGGGFELALAADLIIAANTAEFFVPEATLGIIPDSGGVLRLPRRLPKAIATELLMTGRRMDVEEAKKYGLVNRSCELKVLQEKAIQWAHKIAQSAHLS